MYWQDWFAVVLILFILALWVHENMIAKIRVEYWRSRNDAQPARVDETEAKGLLFGDNLNVRVQQLPGVCLESVVIVTLMPELITENVGGVETAGGIVLPDAPQDPNWRQDGSNTDPYSKW